MRKQYIVWKDYDAVHVEEYECTPIETIKFSKSLSELKKKEENNEYGTVILLAIVGEVMVEALTGNLIKIPS